MDELRECIKSQILIDELSLDKILTNFKTKTLRKGEFLLKKGIVCREMAFIESGYLRMYDIVDGREITLWIGSAGKFITSVSSFVFQTENFWNIQAVTDCEMRTITRDDHFSLCQEQVKWLEFDNLLLAHSFALLQKNMFSQLHTTAQQRLEALLNEEPSLLNNVPLQYIASMLGITPESLSRLRKNIAQPTS